MRKTFTWIADKIFWSLLLSPALAAWLKGKEWAAKISGFLDWIYVSALGVMGEVAFPWIAGILFGFSLGVLLHKLSIWLRSTLSRTEKLFEKLDRLSVNVLMATHNSGGPLNRGRERTDFIDASAQRLFSELQKIGVTIPQMGEPIPSENIEKLEAYVTYIRPFLEDRDLSVLKDRSRAWVRAQAGSR